MKRFLASLLTASAAVLVLLTVSPAAQAQYPRRASSDRQYHRSDRAFHAADRAFHHTRHHTAAQVRADRDLHRMDRDLHASDRDLHASDRAYHHGLPR